MHNKNQVSYVVAEAEWLFLFDMCFDSIPDFFFFLHLDRLSGAWRMICKLLQTA